MSLNVRLASFAGLLTISTFLSRVDLEFSHMPAVLVNIQKSWQRVAAQHFWVPKFIHDSLKQNGKLVVTFLQKAQHFIKQNFHRSTYYQSIWMKQVQLHSSLFFAVSSFFLNSAFNCFISFFSLLLSSWFNSFFSR